MVSSQTVRSIGRIREFVLRPESQVPRIQEAYRTLLGQTAQLHEELSKTFNSITLGNDHSPKTLQQHVRMQGAYTIILSVGMLFNFILRAHDPSDATLSSDNSEIANKIATEASNATQYWPLGSSYMPLCLVAVLSTAKDPASRAQAESLLTSYLTGSQAMTWKGIRAGFEKVLEDIRARFSEPRCAASLGI